MGTEFVFKDKKIGVISDSKERLTAFKKTNTIDPHEDCVFRQFDSLGFEDEILNKLIEEGIKEIIIILRNEKEQSEECFITYLMDWKMIGRPYFNSKTGLQKHISIPDLRKMSKERKGGLL